MYKGNKKIIKQYKGTQLIFEEEGGGGGDINIDDYDIVLELEKGTQGYGTFKLNNKTITPTSSTYMAKLSDLGITELTSFKFANSNITKIVKMPDTSKVTSLVNNFNYSLLKVIDTSSWDLSSVSQAQYAYAYAQKAYAIIINENMKEFAYSNLNGFYGGCTNLVSMATIPSNESTTSMAYGFYGCENLTSAKFYVMTNCQDISSLFENCYKLTNISGNFWPNRLITASKVFKNCYSLDMPTLLEPSYSGNIVSLFKNNTTNDISGFFEGTKWGDDYHFSFPSEWKLTNVNNASRLFANTNIKSFDFHSGGWGTDFPFYNCYDFSQMFSGNDVVEEIEFTNCDFASAGNMSYMFENCTQLRSVKFYSIYNIDTDIVDVSGMFEGCYNLESVECDDCKVGKMLRKALESSGFDPDKILTIDAKCSEGGCALSCDTDKTIPMQKFYINWYEGIDQPGMHFIGFSTSPNEYGDCYDCSWGGPNICPSENSYQKPNGESGSISDLPMEGDYYVLDMGETVYFKCGEQNALFDHVFYCKPSIVTENTISFKYTIKDYLTDTNVKINGVTYYFDTTNGEYLGDDYYKATITPDEKITSFSFPSGNVYELYAIPNKPESLNGAFQNCSSLNNINLNGLDTSYLYDVSYAFSNIYAFSEPTIVIDVSGWDISNISEYQDMFINSNGIKTLILGDVDNYTYNWWNDRLTEAGLQYQVTIECTITG